jgi:hypothetical protein
MRLARPAMESRCKRNAARAAHRLAQADAHVALPRGLRCPSPERCRPHWRLPPAHTCPLAWVLQALSKIAVWFTAGLPRSFATRTVHDLVVDPSSAALSRVREDVTCCRRHEAHSKALRKISITRGVAHRAVILRFSPRQPTYSRHVANAFRACTFIHAASARYTRACFSLDAPTRARHARHPWPTRTYLMRRCILPTTARLSICFCKEQLCCEQLHSG